MRARRSTKKAWEEIEHTIREFQGGRVKVGVIASKGGGEKHGDDGITLVELAAIHEFGSPAAGIPERSFIRATIAKHRSELIAMIGTLARGIILKKLTRDQVMKVLGEWAVAKIRAEITQGPGIPPPLKPATIARKGSSRPLVDTGRLNAAIAYEIVDEAGGS